MTGSSSSPRHCSARDDEMRILAHGCRYCTYGYHGDMATRAFRTTLDPVDPTVRSAAKNLAERLGGDTSVEIAVRAMLDDVAHGARVVVLRTEDEVTPLRQPTSSGSHANSSTGCARTACSPSAACPAAGTAASASRTS